MEEQTESRNVTRRDFLKSVAVLTGGAILASCAPQATPTPEPTAKPEVEAQPTSELPPIGDIPPMDVLEYGYLPPPLPGDYPFDDMSKTYDLTWLEKNWYGVPMQGPEVDPVNEYLNNKMNVNVNLVVAPDVYQQLTLMTAAGEIPDMWCGSLDWAVTDVAKMEKLVNDGVAIGDLQPLVKKYMPRYYWYMGGDKFFMRQSAPGIVDGKLVALTHPPTASWPVIYPVRQDWLDNLGLDLPANLDELFEVAVAFREGDPNRSGKKDTYGITASRISRDLKQFGVFDWYDNYFGFSGLFGAPPVWFMEGDKLSWGYALPSRRDFLAYVKKLVDSDVMPQDWYAIDMTKYWDRVEIPDIGIKPMGVTDLFFGTYGRGQADVDLLTIAWLEGPGGERRSYHERMGWALIQLSAKLLEDEGKLVRLLHIIDEMSWPSSDLYLVVEERPPGCFTSDWPYSDLYEDPGCCQIDEGGMRAGGLCTAWEAFLEERGLGSSLGNWQQIPLRMGGEVNPSYWNIPEGPKVRVVGPNKEYKEEDVSMPMVKEAVTFYKPYPRAMGIRPDPDILNNIQKHTFENEAKFVFGQRSLDEWDDYMQEVLDQLRGRELLEAGVEEVQALGLRECTGVDPRIPL